MSKLTIPGGGAASADLAQRRSRLSAAQRELLEKRLARGAAAPAAGAAVRPRPAALAGRGEALSFAQQRLWRLARRAPNSTAYNVFHGVRFAGSLDRRALAAALGRLVARHEALRTRFPETDQGPVAVVDPASGAVVGPAPGTVAGLAPGAAGSAPGAVPPALPLIDLAALAEGPARQASERALGDQAGRPFDLARGHLLRASLLRIGAAEHVLLLIVHHIVIDGWSLTVLVRDLVALYAEALRAGGGSGGGGAAELLPRQPRPALQAADFALWQRQLLSGGELDEELAWWRRRLASAAPRGMGWPAADRRVGEAPGGSASLRLDAAAGAALKALARRERATLFVVVLAGWKALLNRHAGEDDVLVGTAVALRDRPETAELVGFLLNLLVLRTDLGGDPEFVEVVRPLRLPGLEVEPVFTGEKGSEFDWAFYARETDGAIQFDLGYVPGLFAPGAADALLVELAALLAQVTSEPWRRLSFLAPAGSVSPAGTVSGPLG